MRLEPQTTTIRTQFRDGGYKDVANNNGVWFDHFGTYSNLNGQFIYIHNRGCSEGAGMLSVEFISGADRYNPKTYQLMSVGKDGKSNGDKNNSTVQDNIWAIPGVNAVKTFRDIKD